MSINAQLFTNDDNKEKNQNKTYRYLNNNQISTYIYYGNIQCIG